MNKMRNIRIEKVKVNIGTGKEQDMLNKGVKLLTNLTGLKPLITVAKKRIPAWGLRPGLPIGCKVTLRGVKARQMLSQLLKAKNNILKKKQFDDNGNIAFGINEYIDIPDVKYDPEIGIMGLEVCITLERPGFGIKRRRIKKKKIPKKHRITKEDAIEFMQKNFGVVVK